MHQPPRLGLVGVLQWTLVVALAAVLRFGYVSAAAEFGDSSPAFAVQNAGPDRKPAADEVMRDQKQPIALDTLVHNLMEEHWFGGPSPLADHEERTAHVAPGYPWLVAQLTSLSSNPQALVRCLQCVLGAMTTGCLFLFARRAFGHAVVALLAGILAALHPFWIINSGELADGTLTTFLLAVALWLGTRGSQSGGAFTSLLFGLGLSALAMVRASMLPFGVVGLLWYLYHCKHVRHGWFNAILAFLGFANGLAPWAVRNWSAFEEPVPIVTSAYLHLWIGNNAQATGGPMDETALRQTLPAERLKELLSESNQAKRYARLGQDLVEEIKRDPAALATHRLQAGVRFLAGDGWFTSQRLSRDLRPQEAQAAVVSPEWLSVNLEFLLQGSLLLLLLLGILGWRWSFAWKNNARLATWAFLWVPLPYWLGHAEELCGPRLPWDALLICYSAYAIACLSPTVAKSSETVNS